MTDVVRFDNVVFNMKRFMSVSHDRILGETVLHLVDQTFSWAGDRIDDIYAAIETRSLLPEVTGYLDNLVERIEAIEKEIGQ